MEGFFVSRRIEECLGSGHTEGLHLADGENEAENVLCVVHKRIVTRYENVSMENKTPSYWRVLLVACIQKARCS